MPRFAGIRRFFRLPGEERDARRGVEDELDFHIEMRARELGARGMPDEQARLEAIRRFGDVGGAREELTRIDEERMERQHRAEWWSTAWHDLAYGARSLRKSPGFATVAVLTLALGIGGSAAIFSVVDAVLLRPLPYPEPERLVVPRSMKRGEDNRWNVTFGDYLRWREAKVFQHVALWQEPEVDLTAEGGEPLRATLATVTDGFFPALGIGAHLGRVFRADEFSPGGERPLVISYRVWKGRFGGDPQIVGKTVRISGIPVTIVGVLGEQTGWPRNVDLWYPFRARPDANMLDPDNYIFWSVARLAPGSTLERTVGQLDALARTAERDHPVERKDITVTAIPLREYLVGDELTKALWVLLGAVGFVLLIGCVNVANLLLARASTRKHELAIRTALGAGRARIVRQLLTESVLLAALGCALGVLLAMWGIGALKGWAPDDVPMLASVRLSASVLGFAAAIAAASVLLFGLAPALQASTTDPAATLTGTRTTTGARGRRAASALVVGELALALVLLAGAGLLVRSFSRLVNVDTGLSLDRMVTFQVALPFRQYDSTHKMLAYWDRLRQRLESTRGVQSASVSSALPLGGGGFYLGRTLLAEGSPEPPQGKEVGIMWNSVSPGYFRTLGQPLLAGRDFTARDDGSAPPVIVVNQKFVEEMYGERGAPGGALSSALGKRVISWRDERMLREIVGVVANVKYEGASQQAYPIVYVPLAQNTINSAVVEVRTAGDPAAMVPAIRRELAAIDPEIAMARVATMEDVMSESVARSRFSATLLSGFAGFALLLAAIGVYGLLAYDVTRRGREFGVRMAIGASASDVLRLVLRRALTLATIGVTLGLAGALALTRLLGSLLYEVRATDPVTYVFVIAIFAAVALLASVAPALRATRVEPVDILREG